MFSTSEISDRLPDAPTPPTRKLRIAVAGCAHGEMDKIYAVLAEIEKEKGYKFDLLICCGDYQVDHFVIVFTKFSSELF